GAVRNRQELRRPRRGIRDGELSRLHDRSRGQGRVRLYQAPAGDVADVERGDMELRGLHSSDRHAHGLESAREPPPVPGGLGQPAQETQWRKALYVEPRRRAALRYRAEACGSCTLADRSGELLTSPTCAS